MPQYVTTIHFEAPSDVKTTMASDLAADRMEAFDHRIAIGDVDCEEVLDDNTMSLSESDGETDASRNT